MQSDPYLVADLFCGAGGSSTGAKRAIGGIGGQMELVAINHWNTAIATHSANHPTARHIVEDVSLVDPEAVVEEGRLDLLMASPECRFYSRARGGKPIHDQGRMNPWAVHNWLTKLDVRTVLIENVPEFVQWGPLKADGRPDKAHKGEHFQAWFLTFNALGYQAEWRMLNAADFGDATTRIRFFLIARKDSLPLEWPEPSHAKGDTGMFPGRMPWRGAREVIDWSNPGRSLLDDEKYQKKPLSEKTRRRISRGLERFGGPLAPLYIRLLDLPSDEPQFNGNGHELESSEAAPFLINRHGENGSDRIHPVDEPMPTATTRGAGYLVDPALEQAEPFMLGQQSQGAPRSTNDPLPTIAAAGAISLVDSIAKPFIHANRNHNAPKSMEDPLPTMTTPAGGGLFIVQPSIIQYYGTSDAHSIDRPLSTITAGGGKHGLVNPMLVEYYGNGWAADIDKPLPTVTTKDRHGLVNPTLVEVNHGNGQQGEKGDDRRTHSVDAPLHSITTIRGLGLVEPILVQVAQTGGNGLYSRSIDDPLPTVTTKNDINVVTPMVGPYIVPNFGEREGQQARIHAVDEPMPAVTSRGAGNLVTPQLSQPNAAAVDKRRLVYLDGHPYVLDIRFRMLQNAELARAMGFEDEEHPYEFVGNISEVTKQIGNAVPVNLAAALVTAILGQK